MQDILFLQPAGRPVRQQKKERGVTVLSETDILSKVARGELTLPEASKAHPQFRFNKSTYKHVRKLKQGLDPKKLRIGMRGRPRLVSENEEFSLAHKARQGHAIGKCMADHELIAAIMAKANDPALAPGHSDKGMGTRGGPSYIYAQMKRFKEVHRLAPRKGQPQTLSQYFANRDVRNPVSFIAESLSTLHKDVQREGNCGNRR